MRIIFKYIGAASGVLEINNTIRIGIDPAFSHQGYIAVFKKFDSKRLKAPIYNDELISKTDMWLITHCHEDHIDEYGLNELKKYNACILCDSDKTKERIYPLESKILKWGEEYAFEKKDISVRIKAIPAFHGNNFIMRKMVGVVNGYLITVKADGNEKSIYFTGDTTYHNSIIAQLPKKVDVMIANMGNVKSQMFGGPLTLNIEMLDQYVGTLCPDVVIPVHVDDFAHYDMTIEDVMKAGYMKAMPGDEMICC
ncbi:MAG: MBL fold metallo-hydrolase [Lachnospiraceae bacterium]|nr:MBL fold metallo-hydrolase [Lachnospiraceae bacterium]